MRLQTLTGVYGASQEGMQPNRRPEGGRGTFRSPADAPLGLPPARSGKPAGSKVSLGKRQHESATKSALNLEPSRPHAFKDAIGTAQFVEPRANPPTFLPSHPLFHVDGPFESAWG